MNAFFDNFNVLADAPNNITKVRDLILQLTVQGKLVEQDEREEPAYLLAEKIETEKIRVGEKKGLQLVPKLLVEDNEAPYLLPMGWIWTRLINIGFINPRNQIDDNEIASFVPMSLIPQKYGEPVKSEDRLWGEIRKGFTHFAEGDVVLAKITPCFQNGKAAVMRGLTNNIGAGTTELHVFRAVNELVNPEYVLAYLKSPKFLLDGIPRLTGTAGQKRVPNDYFANNPFPLPPLNEQGRIVAKVHELMGLCDQLEIQLQARRKSRMRLNDATRAPLNKAASLTGKAFEEAAVRLATQFDALYDSAEAVIGLRSTILQLAVQGKLVQQDPHDHSAAFLLERIERDKTRLIQEKKIREEKPVLPITADEKLFPLPRGWEWSKLGSLCYVITDGTHYTPKYIPSGVPFLSVKDITSGKIDFTNTRFISREEHEKFSARCRPEFEDILFTKVGTTGIAKVIDVEREFSIFVSLALLKFSKEYLSPYFLEILLNSPIVRDQSRRDTQGVGNKNLVLKYIKNFTIPLPPLEEQKRIVAKVNQLMTLCDELESKLRQAEADSERLMNAAVQYVLASTVGPRPHEELSVRP